MTPEKKREGSQIDSAILLRAMAAIGTFLKDREDTQEIVFDRYWELELYTKYDGHNPYATRPFSGRIAEDLARVQAVADEGTTVNLNDVLSLSRVLAAIPNSIAYKADQGLVSASRLVAELLLGIRILEAAMIPVVLNFDFFGLETLEKLDFPIHPGEDSKSERAANAAYAYHCLRLVIQAYDMMPKDEWRPPQSFVPKDTQLVLDVTRNVSLVLAYRYALHLEDMGWRREFNKSAYAELRKNILDHLEEFADNDGVASDLSVVGFVHVIYEKQRIA